ncbi:Glycosyltransferase involved in cell wall biogenesis [hydrothermal vent metagenome]|uniref:Glycosyltransferase involved in cell wall biogenesis n=1 Tax=hydrothermal vent metagenome TaxID=652676 RepID=A0A3B1BBG8_9ZZZZ
MTTNCTQKLSIIIPAKNEAHSLRTLLPELRDNHPEAEILIVNDGSTDDTAKLADEIEGITLLNLPYSLGNGGAVKQGTRAAMGDVFIFMDADGQHPAKDTPRLLQRFNEGGFDMVIGARIKGSQASLGRSIANRFYNRLATWMSGHTIPDLTSGFRVVNAAKFKMFLHLLPNGFSYPTTITMSFFRSGYTVAYEPIKAEAREGKSHIKPLRDGMRFLLIIFKIGSFYSPLKLFLPISLITFTSGIGLYAFTYFTQGRFTNMSALLLSTSLLVFLIGLVSEQITSLMFSRREK